MNCRKMDLLTLNQFSVLLWKNFTLKRRQFFTLTLEVLTALVFPVMILLFRTLTAIKVVGPYNYTSHPINTLPSYLKNSEEWELTYVPSNIDVVTEITENMKRNLNISVKVRGFTSEMELEKYIKYDYGSRKVLAAIIFYCNFKSSSDPLPLEVKYHLRFVRIQRSLIWPDRLGWKTSLLFPVHPPVGPRNADYDDGGSPVRLAASAGSLLYFASFFPFNAITQFYGELTLTKKVAACLSSNVALALGISRLLKLELRQIGIRWDNIWTPVNLEDNLMFGHILLMLLLDAFLYGLVTWYIETVFPGQYGVPQPWYFFLMHSYWFGEPKIRRKKEEMKSCGETPNKYFEAEPANLVAGIQIKHLYKEFGDKVVVNNMSLNLYKGQITILLGQNGAGKTTALSLLIGYYPPTRGEVYIHGFDMSKNLFEIRKHLGFCPQHDILFNDLTLLENLFFYSVVKGLYQNVYSMEIDHMLSTFNLLEKRNTFSRSLSGGMKRKLAIIIALIGGSQVMILDEPSSGMDPVSRRATWDLLHQYKQDRTILLTTHYMDEADLLGDRIAIMVKGTLQCCGSSVFLKEIYGAGYQIVMEKESHCDVEKISAIIHSHIPDATVENFTGAELSFILPKEYTQRFEALINDLENKQKELGIANFGASITTMEEVFIKPCFSSLHQNPHR